MYGRNTYHHQPRARRPATPPPFDVHAMQASFDRMLMDLQDFPDKVVMV
jgi:hypothetical protein